MARVGWHFPCGHCELPVHGSPFLSPPSQFFRLACANVASSTGRYSSGTDAAVFFTRGSGTTKLWGLITPGTGDPALNFFEALTWKSGIDGPFDARGRFNWGRNHPENVPLVTRSAEYIWGLVNKYHVTPPAAASMGAREALDFYTNGQAAMVLTLIHFRWKEMNSPDVTSRIGKSVSFEVPGWKPGEGGAAFFWVWGILKTSKSEITDLNLV